MSYPQAGEYNMITNAVLDNVILAVIFNTFALAITNVAPYPKLAVGEH